MLQAYEVMMAFHYSIGQGEKNVPWFAFYWPYKMKWYMYMNPIKHGILHD